MRQFNIEEIEFIIIDDVDSVNTSELFRYHIMDKISFDSENVYRFTNTHISNVQ